MIHSLHLSNFVLVDSSHLTFEPHFTALTGETGAGKTALIEAIALALGARADVSLIRAGAERACVEIAFDGEQLPPATQGLLQEAGIVLDPSEELMIRRELTREGKNRAFIQCQMVPLPLLQKVGSTLLELIDQHSHQSLSSSEFQRDCVDRYGDLQEDLRAFQQTWQVEREKSIALEALLLKEAQRDKEMDMLRVQLTEIGSVSLKEGEEEEIVAEHTRLAHAQELQEKLSLLLQGVSPLLSHVSRCSKTCEALLPLEKSLEGSSSLLHEANIALNEAQHELQSALDRLENSPTRFLFLEERLAAIHRLKRKYGASCTEIQTLQSDLQTRFFLLENLSEEIASARSALQEAERKSAALAQRLTQKRQHASEQLQGELTCHLRSLNMPSAEVRIQITLQPRAAQGDDLIQFWMQANTGEQPVLVKEHASGGELSRLLLSMKLTLAEKNDTPTLIFDEIDANVGGTTASIIGEKLRALGRHRQVICITHFPQVASRADTHIAVQKNEKDGRTLTTLSPLTPQEREQELLRMLGGDREILSPGTSRD